MHRTAKLSKIIIADYHGREVGRSYFSGYSRGVGYALLLAQRCPEAFNGIIGGAPSLDWPGMVAESRCVGRRSAAASRRPVLRAVIPARRKARSLRVVHAGSMRGDTSLARPTLPRFAGAVLLAERWS
ncbi:MAG: tannase/feruloyl esterase family alpha/beta hydrolase [Candidatus Rokuibacteriota bacterium]